MYDFNKMVQTSHNSRKLIKAFSHFHDILLSILNTSVRVSVIMCMCCTFPNFLLKFQVMLPCSKPGELYAIDSDSVNAGIPYADSFYITTHYCMSRTADNESCLAVYAQIKYRKSVWGVIKSKYSETFL
jgi:hypothetical protein